MIRRRALNGVLRNQLQIAISEQQVQARIRELAALQNKRPEEIRKELVDADMISTISAQVAESQITEHALTLARIKDIDADSLE